jgi:hypothetical protein
VDKPTDDEEASSVLRRRDLARPGARFSGSDEPVFAEPKGFFRSFRPRMTVQFLMIVVALSAGATYVGLMAWRIVTYSMRAEYHAQYLNTGRSYLYDSTELRQWHERMQRKYESAASHPWLAAEAGPPRPE